MKMNSVEGDQFADPVLDSELEREGQVLKQVGVETSHLCKGDLFSVLGFWESSSGWVVGNHPDISNKAFIKIAKCPSVDFPPTSQLLFLVDV